MRATIDKAGRLVIPRALRESYGLGPGEVEVVGDGAGVRIEPVATDALETKEGMLVAPASGLRISDEMVQALRDAGQR